MRAFVGCWKKTPDRKNYCFTDEDNPGVVFLPKRSPTFDFATDEHHIVRVRLPRQPSPVEIQTVDELGHRVGNVELVLKSEEGLPDVQLKTDANGYVRKERIRAGRYRVMIKGNGPAYYFKRLEEPKGPAADPEYGEKVEAVVDTTYHTRCITSVVVAQRATPEQRRRSRRLKATYVPTDSNKAQLDGRGTETKGHNRATYQNATDNLVLAAGWTSEKKVRSLPLVTRAYVTLAVDDRPRVNLQRLVSTVLRSWLKDYHPTAVERGYFVYVVVPPLVPPGESDPDKSKADPDAGWVILMTQDGREEDTFRITVDMVGLFGAYTDFEDIAGDTFVDMATRGRTLGPAGFSLDEVVDDGPRLIERTNSHAGQVPILYFAPPLPWLVTLALNGGTGRLEDYGQDEAVNRSIHERNLAVCRTIRRAYEGYIVYYVGEVEKTKDEQALRKLGPPRSPFQVPMPAGVSAQRSRELFHEYAELDNDPYIAIAHQLDRFADRKSAGHPFFRFKFKYTASSDAVVSGPIDVLRPDLANLRRNIPVATEMEYEYQWDVQVVDGEFEVLSASDRLYSGSVRTDGLAHARTPGGSPVEVSFKQSDEYPDKQVVTVKLSKFSMEFHTTGKARVSLDTGAGFRADAEAAPESGWFGAGVTFSLKGLARDLEKKAEKDGFLPPKWAKYAQLLANVEVQFMVGFQGTREETILAILSHAPGFFDRRSIGELLDWRTKWNDLTFDEQVQLMRLGWDEDTWDQKYLADFRDFPASISKPVAELTAAERVAIVHLGFYAYADYGRTLKAACARPVH